MLEMSSSWRKGFSRKSQAPACIALTAIYTSPCPVIMIDGKPILSAFSRASKPNPSMPGNTASMTRRPERPPKAARMASQLA